MDPMRSTDEYFIIENRWRGTSYDQLMSDDGGLAVWHIMENPAVYNSVPPPPGVTQKNWDTNTGWGRRAVRLIRPRLSLPRQEAQALWDNSLGFDLLSSHPDPLRGQLRWADGSPSGFNLRSISAPGPSMQATIDVP